MVPETDVTRHPPIVNIDELVKTTFVEHRLFMDQETEERLVSALISEWHVGGFMGDLRYGNLNEEAYLRMRDIVAEIDFSEEERIPKRLVSLFYNIPDWIEAHRDRVLENGGSKILCDTIYDEMARMVREKFYEKDVSSE